MERTQSSNMEARLDAMKELAKLSADVTFATEFINKGHDDTCFLGEGRDGSVCAEKRCGVVTAKGSGMPAFC